MSVLGEKNVARLSGFGVDLCLARELFQANAYMLRVPEEDVMMRRQMVKKGKERESKSKEGKGKEKKKKNKRKEEKKGKDR